MHCSELRCTQSDLAILLTKSRYFLLASLISRRALLWQHRSGLSMGCHHMHDAFNHRTKVSCFKFRGYRWFYPVEEAWNQELKQNSGDLNSALVLNSVLITGLKFWYSNTVKPGILIHHCSELVYCTRLYLLLFDICYLNWQFLD